MTIFAVAWDVDGTLVDSEPLHHEALIAACRNWNVDVSDIGGDMFHGVHMGDVWLALAPRFPASATERDWMRANDDFYVERRQSLKAMPRAIETVAALAQAGVRQICVSNASRRLLDANIDALGLASFMDFTVSLDDVRNGKPDPEPYMSGCVRLGFRPEQVAAVEDSETGRRAARAAGLLVVAYDHLGGSVTHADHVIRDLAKIPALLAGRGPATMPAPAGGA
ncbi:MAG: HAD family hydrolase [Parvibaculaceae bacterium]